jgi:hypothetical protein
VSVSFSNAHHKLRLSHRKQRSIRRLNDFIGQNIEKVIYAASQLASSSPERIIRSCPRFCANTVSRMLSSARLTKQSSSSSTTTPIKVVCAYPQPSRNKLSLLCPISMDSLSNECTHANYAKD